MEKEVSLAGNTVRTGTMMIIQSTITMINQPKNHRHGIFEIKRRASYDIRAIDFEPPYFAFIIVHIIGYYFPESLRMISFNKMT